MSEEIKEGDVVRLKSGGPKMTVADVQDGMRVIRCVWFDGPRVCRGDFPSRALELDVGSSSTEWIG